MGRLCPWTVIFPILHWRAVFQDFIFDTCLSALAILIQAERYTVNIQVLIRQMVRKTSFDSLALGAWEIEVKSERNPKHEIGFTVLFMSGLLWCQACVAQLDTTYRNSTFPSLGELRITVPELNTERLRTKPKTNRPTVRPNLFMPIQGQKDGVTEAPLLIKKPKPYWAAEMQFGQLAPMSPMIGKDGTYQAVQTARSIYPVYNDAEERHKKMVID
jgi:hypothetical protein